MTNIEWTDCTWNPVIGCQHVAEGCRNCYAEKMSKRLAAMGQDDYAMVIDSKGRFNGKAITRPDTLAEPLHWRKPRKVFVNSMSDLFHKDVPFEFIAAVYGVMAACPHHTFQVLTKRPERMLEFFEWLENKVAKAFTPGNPTFWTENRLLNLWNLQRTKFIPELDPALPWPLPNVWHGTSIAEQKDADRNIPILLQVPSAIRFVSAEPLIGHVDLEPWLRVKSEHQEHYMYQDNTDCERCGGDGTREYNDTPEAWGEDCPSEVNHIITCPACNGDGREWWYRRLLNLSSEVAHLDWIIVGGESGPSARPCDVAWIRSIVSQCKAAGVACFVKQVGSNPRWSEQEEWVEGPLQGRYEVKDRKGGNPDEWEADLRVREFPRMEVPRG